MDDDLRPQDQPAAAPDPPEVHWGEEEADVAAIDAALAEIAAGGQPRPLDDVLAGLGL